MTHPTDDDLDALVALTEEFVTATWHLLDNSEMSGPKDDPIIAVWQPDFDEVSALLDRCEGLPSGSTEHMAAGELLAANMTAAITTLRTQLAEAQQERDDAMALFHASEKTWKAHAGRAEAALAAQIEADAGIAAAETAMPSQYNIKDQWRSGIGDEVAAAIRAQPHDRTALDRHDAMTREKALRDAAGMFDTDSNIAQTIIAMIEGGSDADPR